MAADVKELIQLPKNGSKWGIILFVINFLLVFGNVYLSNGYVSKPTYENDVKERLQKDERLNDRLHDFAIEVKGLKDNMEVDAEQNRRLIRLEERMLEQEKKK